MKKDGGDSMEHLQEASLLDIITQWVPRRVRIIFILLKMLGSRSIFHNWCYKLAGWTPKSFTSSRKNRAEVKQQSILNFLDEDEKAVRFSSL